MVTECGARVPAYARLGNGMRVKVYLGDVIGCHIWHHGWYEPHLVNAIKQHLTADVTFFDIGANIGQYTLLAAPLVQEVHSFEPSKETYALLTWNIEHSGCSNISANHLAVSNRSGIASLHESSPGNAGDAYLDPTLPGPDHADSVQTTTLDEYVFSSDRCKNLKKAILKIDIEGAELQALEGANELLELKPTIMVEVIDKLQRRFGHSQEELVSFLQGHGYVLYSLSENGQTDYDALCPNVLALPRS